MPRSPRTASASGASGAPSEQLVDAAAVGHQRRGPARRAPQAGLVPAARCSVTGSSPRSCCSPAGRGALLASAARLDRARGGRACRCRLGVGRLRARRARAAASSTPSDRRRWPRWPLRLRACGGRRRRARACARVLLCSPLAFWVVGAPFWLRGDPRIAPAAARARLAGLHRPPSDVARPGPAAERSGRDVCSRSGHGLDRRHRRLLLRAGRSAGTSWRRRSVPARPGRGATVRSPRGGVRWRLDGLPRATPACGPRPAVVPAVDDRAAGADGDQHPR